MLEQHCTECILSLYILSAFKKFTFVQQFEIGTNPSGLTVTFFYENVGKLW